MKRGFFVREYLNELNEAQRNAVEDYKGASLVIAGAGSGKTRVLTYRITHLLANGINPYNILALTFTNKAAREMKERIAAIIGEDIARNLWMGTFHSIFARILRYESERLGYTSNYIIYDTIDTKNLIKKIIKEKGLSDKEYKPGQVYGRISSAKNNLITAEAYANNDTIIQQDGYVRRPHIAEIFKTYSIRCKRNDAMDFDDLLLNTNILFRDHKDVLERYQKKFRYILVDEYQDTNFAQYLIVKKLAEQHQNICVVGDDAQSIYSFRGAKIENILNFRNDYKDYKLFKLEQNYRSTKIIVDAANSIIKKNKDQIPKKVYSKNTDGEKIKVVEHETDRDEAYFVGQSIQSMILEKGLDYKDFAILYRTNAQSRSFEESLNRYKIPYKVYGSISFYQRKEIKDILAYFRLIINKNDEEALMRIINYPARGIGNTTKEKLITIARNTGKPVYQVMTEIGQYNKYINSGTLKKIESFYNMIQNFSEEAKEMDAYETALSVARESGIVAELSGATSFEDQNKYENVEELLNGIKEFVDAFEEGQEAPTMERFLENVSLLTDVDNESEDDFNKVTIMTIHSAKGLEFKHVYIVGLEEDLFPSKMSANTQKELEEERRLFYVAVTRAMESVTLCYANERYKWGVPNACYPSRFIKEVDEQFLDLPEGYIDDIGPGIVAKSANTQFTNPVFRKKQQVTKPEKLNRLRKASREIKKAKVKNQDFKPDDPADIQEGLIVNHNRFGIGEVLQLEGTGNNIKAKVLFEAFGEKTLLLKFAKLQIVKD